MQSIGQWPMIDFDKEASWFNALVQLGVIIGTAISTFLGVKVVKKYRSEANEEPVSTRDRTIGDLILEAKLRDKFEDDLAMVKTKLDEDISKAKASFFSEIRGLEGRLREVETQCKVLQSEVARVRQPGARRRPDE